MKKNKLLVALVAAMALVAALPLSAAKKKDGSVTLKKKDVSFENQGGSLTVRNETNNELVIFAGKAEKDTVLGGVRARGSTNFNLKSIPGLPASGSLLIRAASYELYRGKARITEDDVVFTGLVVYNLNDAGDRIDISIYKGIDVQQKHCIYVSNLSPGYVLELRKDTPSQGEVIATLPPLQRHKRVYLEPDPDGYGTDIFPTFIYVDPNTGDKTSFMGKGADAETVLPDPVGSSEINRYEWNGPSAGAGNYKVAFIKLKNGTKKSIEFRDGTKDLLSNKGRRLTPSGRLDTYEIASEMGESGQTYTSLACRIAPNIHTMPISKYVFRPGYVYELSVTDMNGNYEYGIREVEKKSLVDDSRISLFGE